MNFVNAVATPLIAKYATFSGRASRAEFVTFNIFTTLLVGVVMGAAGFALGRDPLFQSDLTIAVLCLAAATWASILLPLAAVTVRRFHDTGLSGWRVLILSILALIPYVGIVVFLYAGRCVTAKGTDGPNEYGDAPSH